MTSENAAGSYLTSARSPFLSTARAAHYLGLTPRHLERMRRSGGGPPFRRHGRFVVYHFDDLCAWSEARRRERIDE